MSVRYIWTVPAGYRAGGVWKRFFGLDIKVRDRDERERLEIGTRRAAAGVTEGKRRSEITLSGSACFDELADFLGSTGASFSQPAAYSLYYNGYLYENMSVTGWKFSQKNGEPEWEFTLEGSPGATSAEPEWQESGRCLIVPRGRQTPQGAGGTRVTRAGAVVSDWYSVNVEVSGLSKAGYYGYASTPSFTGCPKLQGAFSIGVDADPSNVGSFFGTQTEAWTVSNTTDGASFSIGFSAVCLESRGYADEQQLVKSYTGSFAIVENAGGIITAAVDTGE